MRSSATRLLVLAFALTLSVWLRAQVTEQDLRAGYKDASRWVTFSGDYTGQRHSPLTQITPDNVSRLAVQWIFQGNPQGRLPASPLIYDGVIYMTGPNDSAWAIDARTGRQIWRYQRTLPNVVLCCGSINRGFAMLGDRLFKATLDAHVVALSMKTGAILWDTPMADYRQGYSATVAPIVVKDKVILGTAGGEYGARGFIDAYDVATGRRAWRFNVVPGPGEPGFETWKGRDSKAWEHGGGPIWVPGSYDPETNLVYWGTGNPSPNYDGSNREGDNLYTASLVALDADTGKLQLALPVHTARHARLGFRARPGACGSHDRRSATKSRRDGESQRILLRAGSRHRRAHFSEAVHSDDVGEGDWERRPADRAAQQRAQRAGHAAVSRSSRRDERERAVDGCGARVVLRDRPGNLRRLLLMET